MEKGTVTLTAKVLGNPVPEVMWLHNNKPLEPSDKVKLTYDGENIQLTITGVNSEVDSGDYKCVAMNPIGKASHGAKVNVDVETVTFVKKLGKLYSVGETCAITLQCETSHTVSTRWFHDDKELSGMDHRELVEDGHIHKLVIKKAMISDIGSYRCIVRGQKTQTVLDVKPRKPEFIRKLQDIEIKENQPVHLEVEISTETANVTWLKNGKPITADDKIVVEKKGVIRKLLIRSVSIHDEGEYSCRLPDEECTAEVTVIEIPPELTSRMTDVTVTSGEKATFEIEVTKGDALSRWFKDGVELQFSDHVQLSIDGKKQKLKIYFADIEDMGVYTCKVSTSERPLTVASSNFP